MRPEKVFPALVCRRAERYTEKYPNGQKIMQQKDNDQFSFINEKIKEKPVNKKRLLMQAGFIALMAVVFGIIASLVFAYFQPKFESLFCPEEEPVVTIPQDSVAVTELTEETETSEETEASEEPQAPSEEPPLGNSSPRSLRLRMYRTCRTSCMRWEEKQTALS